MDKSVFREIGMIQQIGQRVSSPVFIYPMMGYEVEAIVPVVERAIDLLDPSVIEGIRRKSEKGMVVLKPNWIQESHEYDAEAWEAVITNPTLLLATIQVLGRRLQGAGARLLGNREGRREQAHHEHEA